MVIHGCIYIYINIYIITILMLLLFLNKNGLIYKFKVGLHLSSSDFKIYFLLGDHYYFMNDKSQFIGSKWYLDKLKILEVLVLSSIIYAAKIEISNKIT